MIVRAIIGILTVFYFSTAGAQNNNELLLQRVEAATAALESATIALNAANAKAEELANKVQVLEKVNFRRYVLETLAGKDGNYIDGLEKKFVAEDNILEMIIQPPAVADLQAKIDAVYVLRFFRQPVIDANLDDAGNAVVSDVLENSVFYLPAKANQHVCLTMRWMARTSELLKLLKNHSLQAVAIIGKKNVDIGAHGVNDQLISKYVWQVVPENRHDLFSIRFQILNRITESEDLGSLLASDLLEYEVQAIVTVYKAKPNDCQEIY